MLVKALGVFQALAPWRGVWGEGLAGAADPIPSWRSIWGYVGAMVGLFFDDFVGTVF